MNPLPLLKFDAVAYFRDGSRISTRDERQDGLYAQTPESAARMFLWRLGEAERAEVDRIIVWAPKPTLNRNSYDGPTMVFSRADGVLKLAEVRDG